jgi:hypothetical protein
VGKFFSEDGFVIGPRPHIDAPIDEQGELPRHRLFPNPALDAVIRPQTHYDFELHVGGVLDQKLQPDRRRALDFRPPLEQFLGHALDL